MAGVSIVSAALLVAVSGMEAHTSNSLYKVSLTQRGYIQASFSFQPNFLRSLGLIFLHGKGPSVYMLTPHPMSLNLNKTRHEHVIYVYF